MREKIDNPVNNIVDQIRKAHKIYFLQIKKKKISIKGEGGGGPLQTQKLLTNHNMKVKICKLVCICKFSLYYEYANYIMQNICTNMHNILCLCKNVC